MNLRVHLRLQPISNMFGVRVCGSPPHLLMNGAFSSKCRPKLSLRTLVGFRKIARRLFWRFPSLLETPLLRASFHKACFMCLVSLGVQRFCFTHSVWLTQGKIWMVTACQPLALPLTTSLSACLERHPLASALSDIPERLPLTTSLSVALNDIPWRRP